MSLVFVWPALASDYRLPRLVFVCGIPLLPMHLLIDWKIFVLNSWYLVNYYMLYNLFFFFKTGSYTRIELPVFEILLLLYFITYEIWNLINECALHFLVAKLWEVSRNDIRLHDIKVSLWACGIERDRYVTKMYILGQMEVFWTVFV